MTFSKRTLLLLGAILFVGVGGSYALSLWLVSRDWLPIGISVSSLAIAILAAFKNELFDFDPHIIGGDFALIHSTAPNAAQSGLLFPIHFFNRGYGEGVIVSVAVQVTNHVKNETYLAIPIAEVDIHKLMQSTGRLHATNILGPFMSFPLAAKQVISKSLAFGWVSDNPAYAKPHLEPGKYTFRLMTITDRQSQPHELLKIEHTFKQEQIDSFISGNAIFNMKDSWKTGDVTRQP